MVRCDVTCAAMVPIWGRLGCSRGGREEALKREREENREDEIRKKERRVEV